MNDINAVLILLHQALEPPNLTLNDLKPPNGSIFDLLINHDSIIPPGGIAVNLLLIGASLIRQNSV